MNFKGYVRGDWLANCDRCGFTFLASELRREWTGLRVCSKDWEPRHPQDHVRGVKDRQAPPWTRPQEAAPDLPEGVGEFGGTFEGDGL